MNQYRQERGLSGNPWDQPAPDVTVRAVNRRVSVLVDGVEAPAAEIDTDPFVYGIGAEVEGGVVTAVLPRAELEHVRIQFATRSITTAPSAPESWPSTGSNTRTRVREQGRLSVRFGIPVGRVRRSLELSAPDPPAGTVGDGIISG